MRIPASRWTAFDQFAPSLQPPVRGHIAELDSLRGIAAVIVVLDHFSRFWMETAHPAFLNHVREFPLSLLVNGGSAVIMTLPSERVAHRRTGFGLSSGLRLSLRGHAAKASR